jgi:hypothetical protein
MDPTFASSLLRCKFEEVESQIQKGLEYEMSWFFKGPLKHVSEQKREQVFCFLLASEVDVLSEADFEEIEAAFPLPEVVHKHCLAWVPSDTKLSDADDAELSDADDTELSDADDAKLSDADDVELSDAELYE